MQSTDQKTPGHAREALPVGIEQPGFFPYARFPLSSSREAATQTAPLSVHTESVIWPPSDVPKTARKK